MSVDGEIPEIHAAPRLAGRVVALQCGIRTFWQRWTARAVERGHDSR